MTNVGEGLGLLKYDRINEVVDWTEWSVLGDYTVLLLAYGLIFVGNMTWLVDIWLDPETDR